MADFDLSKMQAIEAYKLLVSIVAPRPIGWISTISDSGVSNLAPFSFFNMLGNNPPIMGFSASINRDGKFKDTFLNAQQTKCFVHNVVTRDLCEKMNSTSENFPYGVSEFEKVGLTPIPSSKVKALRVKESPINLECEVTQIVSFGDQPGNGQLVLGRVLMIHINDESLLNERGLIQSEKLHLISRLGHSDYMDFGRVFSLDRKF